MSDSNQACLTENHFKQAIKRLLAKIQTNKGACFTYNELLQIASQSFFSMPFEEAQKTILSPAQARAREREGNAAAGREETLLISQIAKRAYNQFRIMQVGKLQAFDVATLFMVIDEVHRGGCPLMLEEFLTGDESNFMHDVIGILSHYNRKTTSFNDDFCPRYAR